MIAPVKEMLEVVQRQWEICKEMLELAKAKQPVLVKGNIEDLDKITKQEEALIFEVGRLEQKRSSIHQVLADHFKLSPEDLTAAELEKRLDGETGAEFSRLFKGMTRVFKELTALNDTNTELIKSSLKYINFSLNLLTDNNSKPSYGEKDEKRGQASAKIFDRKI